MFDDLKREGREDEEEVGEEEACNMNDNKATIQKKGIYRMHVSSRTFKNGAEGLSSRYWIEGVGVVSSCAPDKEED